MAVIDFAPPSLLSIPDYNAWRAEFKRCQAHATIAGYRRDKALLEAVIVAELAAIEALQIEQATHESRAMKQGRSSAFMRALRDEYGSSISKHKHVKSIAESDLRALGKLYDKAKAVLA